MDLILLQYCSGYCKSPATALLVERPLNVKGGAVHVSRDMTLWRVVGYSGDGKGRVRVVRGGLLYRLVDPLVNQPQHKTPSLTYANSPMQPWTLHSWSTHSIDTLIASP